MARTSLSGKCSGFNKLGTEFFPIGRGEINQNARQRRGHPKNLRRSLYFLRPARSLNGVTRSLSGYCRAGSMRDKGGSRMKPRGIMEGGRPVGKARTAAPADEEVGRQLDTLHVLTSAIAAASADLHALKALAVPSPLSPVPMQRDLRRQSHDRGKPKVAVLACI